MDMKRSSQDLVLIARALLACPFVCAATAAAQSYEIAETERMVVPEQRPVVTHERTVTIDEQRLVPRAVSPEITGVELPEVEERVTVQHGSQEPRGALTTEPMPELESSRRRRERLLEAHPALVVPPARARSRSRSRSKTTSTSALTDLGDGQREKQSVEHETSVLETHPDGSANQHWMRTRHWRDETVEKE